MTRSPFEQGIAMPLLRKAAGTSAEELGRRESTF
jgi:hypothetical protein